MTEVTEDAWPEMAETEWDERGFARPGTFPISVVNLGAWGRHNQPMPSVETAGCAYCNRWAVDFFVTVHITVDGPLSNTIHRRMEMELIYACDQHLERAGDELTEKYGGCANWLNLDLAHAVEKQRKNANP